MRQWNKWILILVVMIPFVAQAQIDLKVLDRDMAGPRSQVLVLGTVHLREMAEGFNPASLDGMLDRLATFRPDIITIEALSGEECDLAARHGYSYYSTFCASTDAAKQATGLEVPAAITEVDKTLKAWPAQPAPAERRHLAALFLAANDRTSAYVQWLQLPDTERHAGGLLTAALVEMLRKMSAQNSENYQLAAHLAVRLGLQRVYAVDNHTGDNLDIKDEQTFVKEIKAARAPGRAATNVWRNQEVILATAPDLLPLYRYINNPAYLNALADINVGATMRANAEAGYPQIWVAGWEVRNLRMVANIRETFRERPGVRVLSIVGASHKPWFDHWLGQLQGVEIVDVAKVLR